MDNTRYKISVQRAPNGNAVLSVKSSRRGRHAYLSSRVTFICLSQTYKPIDGDREILVTIMKTIVRLYGNVRVTAMMASLIIGKLGIDFDTFQEELSKDLTEVGFSYEFVTR